MVRFMDLLEQATAKQQVYYEQSADYNEFCRRLDNFDDLIKNYIGYALFGSPHTIEDGKYIYTDQRQVELIENIANTVKKHSNILDNVYLIAIYNVTFMSMAEIDKLNARRENEGEKETENISTMAYPIFKIKRFVPTNAYGHYLLKNSYCNWYIDHNNRVYETWEDYLQNNTLQPCTMVFPRGGYYQADRRKEHTSRMTHILVDCCQSPACSNDLKNGVSTGAGILSVSGIALTAVSMLTPVGPVVTIAATVSFLGASLCQTGKSIANLIDRKKHKESLTDKKALADYVTVTSTLLGSLSIGANAYVTNTLSEGYKVTEAATLLHDASLGGFLVSRAVGVGLKTYNTCTEPSITNVVSLVADAFFFGNAVMSVKFSQSVLETHELGFIDKYVKTLFSERHRSAFRNLVETAGFDCEIVRKMTIIDTTEHINHIINFSAVIAQNMQSVFNENKHSIMSSLTLKQFTPIDREFIMKKLMELSIAFVQNVSTKLQESVELFSQALRFLWKKVKTLIEILNSFSPVSSMIRSTLITLFNILMTLIKDLFKDFENYSKGNSKTPTKSLLTLVETYLKGKSNLSKEEETFLKAIVHGVSVM